MSGPKRYKDLEAKVFEWEGRRYIVADYMPRTIWNGQELWRCRELLSDTMAGNKDHYFTWSVLSGERGVAA